jgi:VWFA-related protein
MRRRPSTTTLAAALPARWVALALLAGGAALLQAQPPPFQDRADVVVVEVPVHVLAGREPVRGLTRDDFVVTEGRRKIPIVGFEVIDLALSESGRYWTEEDERALPAAARRHFLFLFDLSFSAPSAILRARNAATELVVSGLHPADLAGVATWSESRGAQLVLNFTGDRRQILAAIESLGVSDPLDRPRDPLKVMVSELASELDFMQSTGETGERLVGISREQVVQDFLDSVRDQQILSARSSREQQQQQVMAFSSSMLDVAGLLEGVDGSAHVVLLSEGFDSSTLLGLTVADEGDRARMEAIQRAVEDGQTWRVDSDERFGNSMALFGLTSTLEAFRRAGAAIQAVDIAGLRAQENEGSVLREAQTRQDGLFILANDTGGQLYRNYNKLSDAMGDLLTRTSVTYLLALQPDVEPDGSYHRIDVELRGGPKNARLVHRPGYLAPLPYSAADPTRRRQENTELILGAGVGGSIASATLAAPVPLPADDALLARVWVPVLIEAEGRSLLAGTPGEILPLEIYGYALREDGSVADYFAQALSIDLAQSRSALASRGFKFWGNLELRPGEYRLRTLVRNGQTGGLALATTPLAVPDPARAEPFLLPALFPEEPGIWVLAQEKVQEKASEPGAPTRAAYPFVRRGQQFLPAARPALTPGDTVEVWLAGVGFDPSTARVVLALTPANDEAPDPSPVAAELTADRPPVGGDEPASPLRFLGGTLTVPDLPPGRYRLSAELEGGGLERPLWSRLEVELR